MNRNEFIKELMSLYPHTFDVNNEAQYKGWIKRYQQLPENWNFDKLMVLFGKNWKSTKEAPTPSWFMEFKEDVKPQKKQKEIKYDMSPEEKEKTDKMIKEFKTKLYEIAKKHKI